MLRLPSLWLAAVTLLAYESGIANAACADDSDCCISAILSHRAAAQSWTNEPSTTSNTFWYETVTSVNSNVPHTTLCDKFPRALVPYQTIESSYATTPTPVSWTTSYIYNQGPYPTPPPTCTIGSAKCIALFSAYSSSSSAAETDPSLPYPTEPPCNLACPATYCRLSGDEATLYYWPVTTTGNFCAATRTTLAGPTTPRSTVIGGTTFISPSAYLRVGEAHARSQPGRYQGSDCGPTRTNVLLTFADASSIRTITYKTGTAANTRNANLGDFNTPAPASLFFTNRLYEPTPVTKCTATPCTTTLQPAPSLDHRIALPTELANVDPLWASCSPLPYAVDLTVVPLAPEVPNWPKMQRAKRDSDA